MPAAASILSSAPIVYRPGSPADSYAVFLVFEESLADLMRRLGDTEPTSFTDPAALAAMWEERRSLYEHLAETAEHFWVAEQAGRIVGFARSIRRDGVRELTEFFVRPGVQASGVGRTLLAHAFPKDGARARHIIASPDMAAQALYLRASVYPHGTVYYWWRAPETVAVESDLEVRPLEATPATLAILAEIDRAVLGYTRDPDHAWLLRDRQGLLYLRGGESIGYGYIGRRNGPFALRQPDLFPAVLAHAETTAAAAGRSHFGLQTPTQNRHAMEHLLARRFTIENFITTLLSDGPFGHFDRYILTSPPFFL